MSQENKGQPSKIMDDKTAAAYSGWINNRFETPSLLEAFQAGWVAAMLEKQTAVDEYVEELVRVRLKAYQLGLLAAAKEEADKCEEKPKTEGEENGEESLQ